MIKLIIILLFWKSALSFNKDKCFSGASAGEADAIKYLPGLPSQPTFKHYSGYLCGHTEQHQLHYWFAEAKNNPEAKPLVLWLNGGPGCSSLLGLLLSHGPYLIQKTSLLEYNSYSWNDFANMLYLESPVGVGFSYLSSGKTDYDDNATSLNSFYALRHFVRKFPRYKGRNFYITGESYAGIYVPLLALRFIQNNYTDLRLKGIVVGNGMFDFDIDGHSKAYYAYYRGFIDKSIWRNFLTHCCHGTCERNCSCNGKFFLPEDYKTTVQSLDYYFIYGSCKINKYTFMKKLARNLKNTLNLVIPLQEMETEFWKEIIEQRNKDWIPTEKDLASCNILEELVYYLNSKQVQSAINVQSRGYVKWEMCNIKINKAYELSTQGLQKEYAEILKSKIPILLYAGDADFVCNFIGMSWFVDDLKLNPDKRLDQWMYTDTDGTRQIGGMVKIFRYQTTPLWRVTVRGAGHMAAENKPRAVHHLVKTFIQGSSLQPR